MAYDVFETLPKQYEVLPASKCVAVTPSDSADLAVISRGIFVGTGGDLVLTLKGNVPAAAGVTFKNVPSGTLLPLRVVRVWSTNTTATDIVAVW